MTTTTDPSLGAMADNIDSTGVFDSTGSCCVGTASHVCLRLRLMCILLRDAHTRTYVSVCAGVEVEEGRGVDYGLCCECANQSLYVDWRVWVEGGLVFVFVEGAKNPFVVSQRFKRYCTTHAFEEVHTW
jgi:hypothetical protein